MRMLLLVATVLAACAIGAVLIAARQQVSAGIAWLSGTGRDMGPIDFATLRRRSTPNDALICPPGHCSLAKPDHAANTYDMPAAELSARLTQMALAEPDTHALPCDPPCGLLRFVQYSRVMRFPDTVDVDVLPSGDDTGWRRWTKRPETSVSLRLAPSPLAFRPVASLHSRSCRPDCMATRKSKVRRARLKIRCRNNLACSLVRTSPSRQTSAPPLAPPSPIPHPPD